MSFKLMRKVIGLFMRNNYIYQSGWLNSAIKGIPVDKNNNIVPWFSYNANQHFKRLLKPNIKVFEYGSGNSTIYMSQFDLKVYSIDHNKNWFDFVKKQVSSNVDLKLIENKEDYINSIDHNKIKYDIIIVDAQHRIDCLKKSIPYVKDDGYIIFDDTNNKDWTIAKDIMIKQGFDYIDFHGLTLGFGLLKTTTFFFRANNYTQLST